jgi:predicted MFS family arabinose efflux permease
MALGYLFSRIAVSKLLKYLGFKKMLTICNIGTFISMLMFCLIDKPDTFAVIIIVANGFFSAVIPLLIYVLCYADVPNEDYASATGLMSTTQQLFFAVGVTLGAACIFICNKIYSVSYGNQTFMTAFVIIALVGLMGQLCFNKLNPDSGEKLANKKNN